MSALAHTTSLHPDLVFLHVQGLPLHGLINFKSHLWYLDVGNT